MVSRIEKDGKEFFQCDDCGFIYPTEELAKRCESWCKEHHSCNLELTKHAVKT